jgi:hypothetical protein
VGSCTRSKKIEIGKAECRKVGSSRCDDRTAQRAVAAFKQSRNERVEAMREFEVIPASGVEKLK